MVQHRYQQVIPRDSTIVEELCACNIFPPMRILGFRENFYVNPWNTKLDGQGMKYRRSQRNVQAGDNGMQFYARYNQLICTINYFYVDGRILAPSLVYPGYPHSAKVTGDANACMSAFASYSLVYNVNGGAGNLLSSERQLWSKYVDKSPGQTVTHVEEVQLARNTFLLPAKLHKITQLGSLEYKK